MENRNEQSGNNLDYNQNHTSTNLNEGSKQEQQGQDKLSQNNKDQLPKKGNPTYIKDMPPIDGATRDLGTVSGVD
ncbi:MAG TPA: hypothetical protein VGC01_09500 [Mucilaginibacter sp.]